MSIVSSTQTVVVSAIDGRKFVVENHTDSTGVVHKIEYLAASGADTNALMLARVPFLEQSLADTEAQLILDNING